MNLLRLPDYVLTQEAKAVELTGEFRLCDPQGNMFATVVETGHGPAHKVFRAVTGTQGLLTRHLELRDLDGCVVATVDRSRGPRQVVIVKDAAGQVSGTVHIPLSLPALQPEDTNEVQDESGRKIGNLRTHGLLGNQFAFEIEGMKVAEAAQRWTGVLRETLTSSARFTFHRGAEVSEALLPLVFCLPLVAELALTRGGGISPLGAIVAAFNG